MRTDFENLQSGDRLRLHPNAANPLHKRPIEAVFEDGYFFCKDSDPMLGPDYYMGDVAAYNDGFEVLA